MVITKEKSCLLLSLFEEKKPYFMRAVSLLQEETILGNIYLARVDQIVPGINGAFLSIDKKQKAYLPLAQMKNFLIGNRDLEDGEQIKPGDEVVIQIEGEALKKKQARASADLVLTGQYCVCSYWGNGLSYSKKLSEEKTSQIRNYLQNAALDGRKKYQFTIRTNVENLTDYEPLLAEMRSFIEIFDTLADTYRHRTCYTCFYHKESELISQIKNVSLVLYDEIVTDDADVFQRLENVFTDKKIRFYQDNLLALSKLYSINTHLQEALGKRVWLPCGGYLVIEPTEAMVVIDVNSGKTESKGKKSRDYYLKVNLEAAKEVARQLRIRNYSGMIMVDFISMETKEDNQKLLERLDAYLQEDKVKTRLVDMTALGIVEITRKKVSRPLGDFFLE